MQGVCRILKFHFTIVFNGCQQTFRDQTIICLLCQHCSLRKCKNYASCRIRQLSEFLRICQDASRSVPVQEVSAFLEYVVMGFVLGPCHPGREKLPQDVCGDLSENNGTEYWCKLLTVFLQSVFLFVFFIVMSY